MRGKGDGTRTGYEDEEKQFHRENAGYRAAFGGNEWCPLDMLDTAREFLTSQPFTEGHALRSSGGIGSQTKVAEGTSNGGTN
jgi:hypothetical protein